MEEERQARIAQTQGRINQIFDDPNRAADIRQALEIPEDKLHCALMGEDAVKSLVGAAHGRD